MRIEHNSPGCEAVVDELVFEIRTCRRTWLLVATFSLAANFFILCHLVVNHPIAEAQSEVNSPGRFPVCPFGAAALLGETSASPTHKH